MAVRPPKPIGLPPIGFCTIRGNKTVHLTMDGQGPLCNTAHENTVDQDHWGPVTCKACYSRGRYVERWIGRLLAVQRRTSSPTPWPRSTGATDDR